MNQLTISAANAATRVASVDRDVASSLGAAECSSLSLSLSFSFIICICIQAFISASSPTRSLTLPLFLPFCISISLSLSLSLSLCGEWRGTESCRKHYVKWPPWLKIHPLNRATLATAAGSSSRRQLQPNCVACHKAHPPRPHPPQHLPNATENSCFLYKHTHTHT